MLPFPTHPLRRTIGSRCWSREGNQTASTQGRRFHQRFVPAAFFHQLDELDRIACAGIAVAAEAAIRIGLG